MSLHVARVVDSLNEALIRIWKKKNSYLGKNQWLFTLFQKKNEFVCLNWDFFGVNFVSNY